jgi:hypothetical protein
MIQLRGALPLCLSAYTKNVTPDCIGGKCEGGTHADCNQRAPEVLGLLE